MPKPLDLPADLIDLQRAALAADAAVSEYALTVQARRREQFPAREQVIERCTWDAAESAELDRLRDAYIEAATAVRAHPIWQEARAQQAHGATWQALRDAAKAPATV